MFEFPGICTWTPPLTTSYAWTSRTDLVTPPLTYVRGVGAKVSLPLISTVTVYTKEEKVVLVKFLATFSSTYVNLTGPFVPVPAVL